MKELVFLICLSGLAIASANPYTTLYNKVVERATEMERPLGSSGGSLGYGLPHSGVVVALNDGSTWLVHKGRDYSQGSSGCEAVVTDDIHMSSAWNAVRTVACTENHSLGSYVQEAGCQYNLFYDNCWDATERMMDHCSPPTGGWWWGR